jgi:peptidoglycan hydrolase-like protein with peptidoglycan-binding domain
VRSTVTTAAVTVTTPTTAATSATTAKSSATTAKSSTSTTAATFTPEPTSGSLQQGVQGPRVRLLQKQLAALGYYSGAVDGKFGAKTTAAVKKFQTAQKLTADGIAGTKTLAAVATACKAKAGCPTS